MASAETSKIPYPSDALFDIETLVNVAQPLKILLIGEQTPEFLNNYLEQKRLLSRDCEITHIRANELDRLSKIGRHDVGIAVDVFEHIDKSTGIQMLSRLRDLLCHQYCICLPIRSDKNISNNSEWQMTDMFGFALERVALYDSSSTDNGQQFALFKYNISDYKKTPDWLNADNWANPQMWGKYRW